MPFGKVIIASWYRRGRRFFDAGQSALYTADCHNKSLFYHGLISFAEEA
jgi:hypothetical protein